MDIRFSIRSRRAITPSVPWSAPGSSTRAQISSSSSRGAVAPLSSVRPSATSSADRLRSARPKRAAWAVSRSPWSCGTSIRPVAGASGTAEMITRSRSRRSRSSVNRRGSWPVSITLSTAPNTVRAVAGGEGVDDLVEQGVGGEPEQPGGELVGDALGARAAHQLVEHREGVAGGAAAGPDHQRAARPASTSHALLGAQLAQVVRQRARRDQPERVVVGPRPDRADHLVGLGGREHELEVLGRLLDELEQRVEALRGDHVRLVDDVDLVAAADRREERPLAQVAGVVHAAVAGRVDLDDVDGARAAAGQVGAGPADAARAVGRALLAVEAARQDPGAGGLAAAARAGEEVGVVHPVVVQRRAQRRR